MVIEVALLLIDNGGRTLKKVRRRPNEPLDPDDPIVDDKGMKEEDLELDDRDAKNETIDGIPNITFSDQIQLPGPQEGMYTKSLLRFIGGAIGLVAKIDRNTKNNTRGQLTRLAVYVELGKPLVSKAKIDGRIHWVERAEVEDFWSWIIVEWKQRRTGQPLEGMNNGKGSDALNGSKFDVVRI
ncbi:hypothetical protein Golob_002630, partial [Gossypium lobatum]|nr:hypothetical protein [Gossypium lobatum]